MKSNICPAPWYHMSTDTNGSIRPCCRYAQPHQQDQYKMPFMKDGNINQIWNGEKFKKLRQAFIDNKKPKECEICWKEEENNIRSYRQNLTDWFPYCFDNVNFDKNVAPPPTSFDFKVTNLCNMKCRICGPTASSLFLEEAKQYTNIEYDPQYLQSNKITQTSNREVFLNWLPHIRRIEITGGEPLVSPENKEMIELMVEKKEAHHIDLQITTNGKIFNKKFNENFKLFERVILCLSIDDIKERFEYQRYPSNWKKVKQNIDNFFELDKDDNIEVFIYCTVSNHNVFYLDEYCQYFSYLNDNKYNFGLLHHNDYWSIQNLHPYAKQLLIDKLYDINKLQSVVDFLRGKSDNDLTHRFLHECKRFDRLRNQNFKITFPEWYEILSMCSTI